MQALNKETTEHLFSRYLELMKQLKVIYHEGMIIARKSENLLILINSGLADDEIISLITGDASAKRKPITTEPTKPKQENISFADALFLIEDNKDAIVKEIEMPDSSVARLYYRGMLGFHFLSIIRRKDFSLDCIRFY